MGRLTHERPYKPHLRRIEPVIGNEVAHPLVGPLYLLGCFQIDCPRVPQFSVAIVSHP